MKFLQLQRYNFFLNYANKFLFFSGRDKKNLHLGEEFLTKSQQKHHKNARALAYVRNFLYLCSGFVSYITNKTIHGQ